MNRRANLLLVVTICTGPTVGLAQRAPSKSPGEPIAGDVTDLKCPAAEILKRLPGVARVEIRSPANPKRRLIHLRDYHFVTMADFAADLRSQQPGLSDSSIDERYAKLLKRVAIVQAKQKRVLQQLIKRHGLREVCVEGLATEDVPIFKARIAGLRKVYAELKELAALKDDLSEESRRELVAIEQQHRLDLLQVGVAGQLLLSGNLERVLPTETFASVERANPVKGSKVTLDAAAIEERESAIVKRVVDRAVVALIVLGGAHDLADNVPDDCEYLRLTVASYPTLD